MPMTVANMVGQELEKVRCWWKPGMTQCISLDAAVSTRTAAAHWALGEYPTPGWAHGGGSPPLRQRVLEAVRGRVGSRP